MQTLSNAPMPLKLLGAALALALLAAAALAVALTTGPAAAQSPDNAYADPQPCGPGAETAYQPEPHEITAGHFALFDAYWQWLVQDPADENVGILHTNLCPPLVTQTTETDFLGRPTTVTRPVDSNIDINEAIFHVLDTHKVTVVEGAQYTPGASQLPADQYPELVADEHINVGSEVWWLRLDDPNTDVDETPDLTLGFSTMRFDSQYWGDARYGGPPFRYKFEVERDPGIEPGNDPHLFVYQARQEGESRAELLWSSAQADVTDLAMEAGELEDLQWVFTQPGTYEIWLHLQGWVRHPANGEDWAPISEYETETSEVKRYVIHVGDDLTLIDPPLFGVNRSVPENSPAGTAVGDLISVFQRATVDTLDYRLRGEGNELFSLVPATKPHSVQLAVAEGALLDYEAQSSYDLTLRVSDNLGRTNYADSSEDHILAVRVDLEDIPTGASIQVDNPNSLVGETVTFTGVVTDFGAGFEVRYGFTDSDGITQVSTPTHTIRRDSPTTEKVGFYATYDDLDHPDGPASFYFNAPSVIVTWRNP